jgi:ribosome-associated heat shock protein Hsp15
MAGTNPVRIDKFLWAVRLYKTRSIATDACQMGRVLINNSEVKPSRMILGGELLTVKKPPVTYSFFIRGTIENRVAAKLVPDFLEDRTPDTEKIKLEVSRTAITGYRKKGTGRPTKKERRTIDKWQDDFEGT